MEKSVLEAIKRFNLLDSSKNITVALSGGADSMSLLYLLYELRDKLEISISAAHLNHMIRGAEADRDEAFVRKTCEELNIPLFCEKQDVPKYAEEHKMSLELAAREVRYNFLKRVADGVVATAHTASDNLETVLFNLTRGTAISGLCGIPPKRDIFIRPLILTTREEVENYCTAKKIDFITDSTNLSDEYTRNNIRHNVIPVLKQINPSVEASVIRTSIALTEDNDYLNNIANSYLAENIIESSLSVKNFSAPAIGKRAIKKFALLTEPKLTLDNGHINEIYEICKTGGRVSLPLDMSAVVKKDRLFFEKNNLEKPKIKVETAIQINDLFKKGKKVNNLLLNSSLDCDKIMGKLVCRTRASGDKIRLSGRGCTKPLKKLMSELAIPNGLRDTIPVLADDLGPVWVYGIGVAARCSVNEKTKQIISVKVIKI